MPANPALSMRKHQWQYYLGDATTGGVPLTGVVCHETASAGAFTCATELPKITGWVRFTGQASGQAESAPAVPDLCRPR